MLSHFIILYENVLHGVKTFIISHSRILCPHHGSIYSAIVRFDLTKIPYGLPYFMWVVENWLCYGGTRLHDEIDITYDNPLLKAYDLMTIPLVVWEGYCLLISRLCITAGVVPVNDSSCDDREQKTPDSYHPTLRQRYRMRHIEECIYFFFTKWQEGNPIWLDNSHKCHITTSRCRTNRKKPHPVWIWPIQPGWSLFSVRLTTRDCYMTVMWVIQSNLRPWFMINVVKKNIQWNWN